VLRSRIEVAIFVTRRRRADVLIVHRSPPQGSYWHVIAGGVEPGEELADAARRELREETGLVAEVGRGERAVSYTYPLTEESPERRARYDPSVVDVAVSCFQCEAPDGWEPELDWEHDDYRWCAADEAIGLLFWPEPREVLQELAAR